MIDQLSASARSGAVADDDVLVGGKQRRIRWRRSPAARALLSATALFVVAAMIFGFLAFHATTPRRVLTVPAVSLPGATTTDAVGCPVDQRCMVQSGAGPRLISAFLRTYPKGHVTLGERTVDVASARVYRAWLTGDIDPQTTLTLSSQCVPDGSALDRAEARSTEAGHWDLANNWLVYARSLSVLYPGQAGCSVRIQVERVGNLVIDSSPALALARDPSAQVTP